MTTIRKVFNRCVQLDRSHLESGQVIILPAETDSRKRNEGHAVGRSHSHTLSNYGSPLASERVPLAIWPLTERAAFPWERVRELTPSAARAPFWHLL
jgi:hypothetical protein